MKILMGMVVVVMVVMLLWMRVAMMMSTKLISDAPSTIVLHRGAISCQAQRKSVKRNALIDRARVLASCRRAFVKRNRCW